MEVQNSEAQAPDGTAWREQWSTTTFPLLKRVRAVAVAERHRSPSLQRALRTLAAHPALAEVCTEPSGEARGRLLRGAIVSRVQAAAASASDTSSAVLALWARVLERGETNEELAGRPPVELRALGRVGDREMTTGKVRYWLGAFDAGEDRGPAPALRILNETIADLRLTTLVGLNAGEAALAAAAQALQGDPVAHEVLRLLATGADEPFDASLFDNPANLAALPPALGGRLAAGARRPAAEAVATLVSLGLAERVAEGSLAAVRLAPGVRSAVRRNSDARQRRDDVSYVTRLLDIGLPQDPTEPSTWKEWATVLRHVEDVTAQVVTYNDDLLVHRAGKLLDKAAVYLRLGAQDSRRAEQFGRAALRAMDQAGRRDPDAYSAARVNLASATRDPDRRLETVSEALVARLEDPKADPAVVLGTRLAHANALDRVGRTDEARELYAALADEALALLQQGSSNSDGAAEVLHDYAAFLLEGLKKGRARDGDLPQSLELLQSALRILKPGRHGFWQAQTNWGDAMILSGRTVEAEGPMRELYRQVNDQYGDSDETLHVLATLLDAAEPNSAPDLKRLLKEATRIDRVLKERNNRRADEAEKEE